MTDMYSVTITTTKYKYIFKANMYLQVEALKNNYLLKWNLLQRTQFKVPNVIFPKLLLIHF